MKTLKLCCVVLLCSFTFLSLARGELIPYQIEGLITASHDPNNPINPFPGVSVGGIWTANFTVDTSASDLNPDPSIGNYLISSPLHLTMGSVNRDYLGYHIGVGLFFPTSDRVTIQAPNDIPASLDLVTLALDYVKGTFLGSDSIPPLNNMPAFLPSTGDLNFAVRPLSGPPIYTVYVTGEVTSITTPVPEPSTMLLLGSGLLGLWGARKKFKK